MKTFAEKNIWSQLDTARRFPPHSCDTISAWRNPMKYIIFDSPIRVLLRISLLQCMEGTVAWNWWNLARIYKLHCFHGHGHDLFLHRWCFFIEDWEFPTIDHCLISSGCWMLHFILQPDAHLGATILQVTLHQDWSTLGMRYGQQGDITSIFINVGHNGITNRELDMFALRKIQL